MTTENLNHQIEKWLHARVTSFQVSGRPFITLSYAQSWDGSITTRSGESMSFSGEESLQLTHQLRAFHDGILVGIGTVLSDDPQLTVRGCEGSNPQPIVLDTQLRTPLSAKICHHPDKQCWVLTTSQNTESMGESVDVLALEDSSADRQEVPLHSAMRLLKQRGINTLMVEGGATVITAFLKARLADALILTVAPRLVGGYKAVGDLQAGGCDDQVNIHPLHSAPAGKDIIVWGGLQYEGA